LTPTHDSPERQLQRKIAQTRRVMFLERLWPRLWLPVGVAGAFVLVSLFGLWSWLAHDVHLGLLWGFAVALVAAFVPALRVRIPTRDEALRRLETRSGVPHRPGTALEDQPAGKAGQAAQSLWQAYRQRMAEAVGKLKPGTPHPRTDRFDPLALRSLLALLLIVAFVAHWGEVRQRIASAFDVDATAAVASLRVDAWIAPPVYTGKPPITLSSGALSASRDQKRGAWEVPEGSELTIRVNNADPADLSLKIEADGKSENVALKAVSRDGETATGVATVKRKLEWSQTATLHNDGRVVAAWPLTVIADDAPVIQFTKAPGQSARKALQLDYKAQDDYGIASAKAEVRLIDEEGKARKTEGPWPAPEIALNLPGTNLKSIEGQTFKDLTAHPWAGMPVEITLAAEDLAGQTGYSNARRVTLPARKFTKPLARAVIEQRRALVASPRDVRGVVRMLNALTMAPDQFVKDKVVYMGLRSAYWRLVHDTGIESVKSVVDQLWKVALRIENGDLSDAEARLRVAQERLREALQENASAEEIERLMSELRSALSEFLQAMAEQMRQQTGDMAEMPPIDPDRMLSASDLDKMLQDIEDLAKTGSREAAQQMLSQLRSMLENLRQGRPQTGRAGEMMEMLKKFSEIVREQQRLLDETYRARRQGDGPGEPRQGQGDESQRQGEGRQGQGQQGEGRDGRGGFGDLGARQEQLRETLRRLMEQMRRSGAKTPGDLDGAGEAMGEAGDALGRGDGERATQQQTLALDRLRKGAQSMAQQILEQLGRQRMGQAGPGRRGRDPLGRPQRNRGADTGDSVEIPEEFAVERAREILRELRRRLSDPSRPAIELDYLERLIERF